VSVTRALIAANVAAFGLQLAYADAVVAPLALWPVGTFHVHDVRGTVGFHPWQLVTYAFLHANLVHLVLNMFALHMFGRDVERALGGGRFLELRSTVAPSRAMRATTPRSAPSAAIRPAARRSSPATICEPQCVKVATSTPAVRHHPSWVRIGAWPNRRRPRRRTIGRTMLAPSPM
jgi:hypothetical protein